MLVESRKIYFYLCVLLIVDFLILLWVGKNLSISYDEASHFFEPLDFGGFLSNLSVFLFGQNDIGLRMLFLLLHLCNAVLMFIFAKGFLKRPSDALFCVLLFLRMICVCAWARRISPSQTKRINARISLVIVITPFAPHCSVKQSKRNCFRIIRFGA